MLTYVFFNMGPQNPADKFVVIARDIIRLLRKIEASQRTNL